MQAFTSSLRNGSPNPKRSPSPKITRSSSVSSDSADSRASKVSEWKPSSKSQSFQEKQRSMRVPDLMDELRREREEKFRALEELTQLKKRNEGSRQIEDRILIFELEAEKAKESERKMLESLISQTKQLEQTKISLEEAKLEMRNLQQKYSRVSSSCHDFDENESLTSVHSQEELMKLRNELRLALQAEEKSKKAMDDFAFALKEVTCESNQAKAELAASKSESQKAREDAEHATSLLRSTEQKLKEALEGYDKMKLEYEESTLAWKAKEDSFRNCMEISEEDMDKKDEENSRLANAHRAAREENLKLRDIIKQAVNEAMVVKESLEIARYENYDLKEQLSRKENALQQMRKDYESLKLNEASAFDSARELKSMLASSSGLDSNKVSQSMEAEWCRQSKAANDDRKISRLMKKFPSDRWTNKKPLIQNNHRHSIGESDVFKDFVFDKEGSSENPDIQHSSTLFGDDHLNSDKEKKKKTAFGRFGDALRRRSFRKS